MRISVIGLSVVFLTIQGCDSSQEGIEGIGEGVREQSSTSTTKPIIIPDNYEIIQKQSVSDVMISGEGEQ